MLTLHLKVGIKKNSGFCGWESCDQNLNRNLSKLFIIKLFFIKKVSSRWQILSFCSSLKNNIGFKYNIGNYWSRAKWKKTVLNWTVQVCTFLVFMNSYVNLIYQKNQNKFSKLCLKFNNTNFIKTKKIQNYVYVKFAPPCPRKISGYKFPQKSVKNRRVYEHIESIVLTIKFWEKENSHLLSIRDR